MFIFAIIIVLLSFFLFIPIPLKFKVYFSQDNYYIYFYRLDILSKNHGLVRKFMNNKKNKSNKKQKSSDKNSEDSKSTEKETSFKNKKQKKSKLNIDFKKLFKNIKSNKFKPKIKFDSTLNYSLGDAANTAISVGILYNLNPILYFVLSILFKVKKLNLKFNPIFKDKIIYELTLTCIITFNLAQIIYMLILFIKSTSKIQEVS